MSAYVLIFIGSSWIRFLDEFSIFWIGFIFGTLKKLSLNFFWILFNLSSGNEMNGTMIVFRKRSEKEKYESGTSWGQNNVSLLNDAKLAKPSGFVCAYNSATLSSYPKPTMNLPYHLLLKLSSCLNSGIQNLFLFSMPLLVYFHSILQKTWGIYEHKVHHYRMQSKPHFLNSTWNDVASNFTRIPLLHFFYVGRWVQNFRPYSWLTLNHLEK